MFILSLNHMMTTKLEQAAANRDPSREEPDDRQRRKYGHDIDYQCHEALVPTFGSASPIADNARPPSTPVE